MKTWLVRGFISKAVIFVTWAGQHWSGLRIIAVGLRTESFTLSIWTCWRPSGSGYSLLCMLTAGCLHFLMTHGSASSRLGQKCFEIYCKSSFVWCATVNLQCSNVRDWRLTIWKSFERGTFAGVFTRLLLCIIFVTSNLKISRGLSNWSAQLWFEIVLCCCSARRIAWA